jgi:voltage-gated potassium channel Kch
MQPIVVICAMIKRLCHCLLPRLVIQVLFSHFNVLMSQYMHSVYWAAATLTTVGYGDVAAVSTTEQVISLFVFAAGSAVYTMVSCTRL